MPFGGFRPWPRRFGGAHGRTIKTITGSLATGRGSAYDPGNVSIVWLECASNARAIAAIWEMSRKFANQFVASRMSEFLPRWERIFGIYPKPSATLTQRRDAVAVRFSLIGKPCTQQQFEDLLRTLLPNTFDSVVYGDPATALSRASIEVVADGGVTTPTGTVTVPADADYPWWSSIHHIAIKVVQPSGMSDADFRAELAAVHDGVLRRFVPSWVTFDWFQDDPTAGAGWFADAADPPTTTIPNVDRMRLDS